MNEMNFLQDLLILFGAGIVAVVAFHRLNLPPVLGFLLTGIVCGPYGFGLIEDIKGIEALAEIGVVLLLFTIGIEFSINRLKKLRRFMLLAGGLQVGLTIGATALLGTVLGIPWAAATFLGMLVSLSSTVIVLRILEYRGELDSAHGRAGVSILIFQDLLIVPMVMAIPYLSGNGGDLGSIAWTSVKALLFVALCGTVARYVVPWLLNQIARTRRREAFVLSIILLCLGTATATAHVGLSMALGAFVAGLVLSESKYNHQALSEILPFREVFNCLVFVSIGMLFDVHVLLQNPGLIALALTVVVVLKALITSGVTFAFGHSLRVSALTGLALAQVSEFSFVLAKLGVNDGLLDARTHQTFLAVAILSMAVTPALTGAGARIGNWLERVLPGSWTRGRGTGEEECQHSKLTDHVIIAGFGLAGRQLSRVLTNAGIAYVVIDMDPMIVKAEKARGVPIFYGDAGSQEVLEHAGVSRARVLALTLSDATTVLRSAELARRLNHGVHIIARARFMEEVEALIKVGAHEVVPEEFMGSIEIFTRVLQRYLVPRQLVDQNIAEVRRECGENCQEMFLVHRPGEALHCVPSNLALDVHRVEAGSTLAGKPLMSSGLRAGTGTTVVAIQRRDGKLVLNPTAWDMIGEGDTVILLGRPEQLKEAGGLFHKSQGPPPPGPTAS